MADLFVIGLLAHLFADWFLQNDYQAQYKVNLLHRAAWVHFACHLACMLIVWPWYAAIAVAVSHALIDTRKPLVWWRTLIGQKQVNVGLLQEPYHLTPNALWPGIMWNVAAMQVAFWQDQAAHLLVLGIVAWALAP